MDDRSWTEDTVPSRRTDPDAGARETASPGLSAIPARVWILGGLVGVVALAAFGLWGLMLFGGQLASDGPTPTPIILMATAAPTFTPVVVPTETDVPLPTTSPDIAIGRYVRVTGTGDVGLSLRAGPGGNYDRVDIASEGEIFIVVDGPRQAGGYDWWKVRDPDNVEREWWAAGNFLEPVDHP
jgi:hypothetical protein